MKKFGAILALTLTSLWFSTGLAAATQPDPEHKVTICHRTASDTNPYVFIEVDEASLDAHLNNLPGHPAKPWKTDGTFRGVAHVAGDLKYDYLAETEADCYDGETPPPNEEVTATAPTFTDPDCDTAAGLVIPQVDGVIYSTEGTVAPGSTVTVTATADEGYTLVGTSRWIHTYGQVPTDCEPPPPPPPPEPEVRATAPTFVDPDCDVKASMELPEVEHVTYSAVGEVAPGATVTVTATADEGYELVGRSEWTHTFGEKPEDCGTPPPPPPPPPTPPCTGPECHDLADTGFGAGSAAIVAGILSLLGSSSLWISRRRVT